MLDDFVWPKRVVRFALRLRGDRARFRLYRRMALQLSAGRPVRDVVNDLAGRANNRRGRQDPEYLMLSAVSRGLEGGASLSRALSDWLPSGDISQIAASESSGQVPEALNLLISLGTARKELVKTTLSGMGAPLALLFSAYGLLYYMSAKVMPAFAGILKGHPVHGLGAATLALARVARGDGFLIGFPVGLIMSLGLIIWSFPRWTGSLRKQFDQFPPWSFYRRVQGALWLSSFSALVQAGMQEKEAIRKLMAQASPWLTERMRIAEHGLVAGQGVAAALSAAKTHFPDDDTLDDMTVMASFPDYGAQLARLSSETLRETQDAMALASKAMASLFQGIVIGLIILMFLGIVSIVTAVAATVGGGAF